ncbi:thiosulfate oxidation carrier protein SoxY [Hansschlegelia sp. KR7-227]|jgi:sulfur-oxidizing protein SoxY|uniref:thiosulfate oxidation carrier protein SoxY n=1 Tax=Hansschlegelia sp. KR7-227 TaxID=3400914 RepID=UPI003BFD8414
MTLFEQAHSRREALRIAAIAAAVVALTPRLAFAKPEEVKAEMDKLYGAKEMTTGKLKLDMPEIAENGLVVPINIEVESPMTEADYVKSVNVFAEGNPFPRVLTYRFTPACGRAGASLRMRLAQTQNVIAVAETSTGQLYMAKSEVKVTIGGCGG